ncbi:WXG100 family type VII secretion target, partial [Bacillus cereus]
GASNQQFIQMFNEARPKAFTSINSIIQVEEDLKRIAEKFRNTDNQDVTMVIKVFLNGLLSPMVM